MNKEDVLKEMKESVGTKDPEIFFSKMVDLFSLLFDKIDSLSKDLERVQLNSTMAIHWDERLAMKMVNDEIQHMRATGKDHASNLNIYSNEIYSLQCVYKDSSVIKNYVEFCKFWQDTLGYHPFLEARQE